MLNGAGAAQESLQPPHPSPGPAWIQNPSLHLRLYPFPLPHMFGVLEQQDCVWPPFPHKKENDNISISFPVRLCPVLNLFLCCANRPCPCFLLFVAWWAPFSRRMTIDHHLHHISSISTSTCVCSATQSVWPWTLWWRQAASTYVDLSPSCMISNVYFSIDVCSST